MPTRLLLDTSSLMYRAFFALPASIRGDHGRPVNAVFGYLDMVARLLETRRPDAIVHVYDDAIVPEARARAYPAYKAHRVPDPEGLPWQFDLLEEVLDAFGAERAVAEGWEADDAIGALCAAARPGEELEVVTGDRDLYQLVRDGDPAVRVLFTIKGVTELGRFDEAAIVAKCGVSPGRYVDFAILRGDPSDGLPGVRGIGEKTARRLIEEHGSLDALLAAAAGSGKAAGLTPRLTEAIRESAEYIRAMREVVPVRREVPVTVRRGDIDPKRLAAATRMHKLRGPIGRLANASGIPLPEVDGIA